MMIQCSPAAYAKCPTRALCGRREEATFAEGSECDLFNRSVEDQPMTNADRIRAMSDEQLCDLIMEFPAVPCDAKISIMMKKTGCADCQSCIREWLQQPAEVDLK